MSGVAVWRPAFILSALLLMVGAPQHPGGTMVEMLAHPAWVRAHSLMLAGFVALFVGLLFFRANPSLPDRTQRWTRYALVGTVLQIVEMVLHTAKVVDRANLAAGYATPVLTTHLAASLVILSCLLGHSRGVDRCGGEGRCLGLAQDLVAGSRRACCERDRPSAGPIRLEQCTALVQTADSVCSVVHRFEYVGYPTHCGASGRRCDGQSLSSECP